MEQQPKETRVAGGAVSHVVAEAMEKADQSGVTTVPTLALLLLSGAMAESHRLTDSVIENLKEEVQRQKRRADRAERGLESVWRVQAMLTDPMYAERLIVLLGGTVDPIEAEPGHGDL